MLRVIRWMSEATGRSECELKSELCEELREWEAEVKAMSKMLGAVAVVGKKKAAAGKKKGADAVAQEAPKEPEEPEEPEAVAQEAPKEPDTQGEKKEEPKKKAAAKKKKGLSPEAGTQEAPKEPEAVVAPKKKAAAKKKAPGVVEGETEAAAPKKKAAAKKKAPEPEAVKPDVEWNVKVVVTKDEEEEEEVEVEEMEYNGVKYLKSSRGVVYDIETSEEVGVWNEETKSIETD